jgi:hypothetical protein
MTVKMETRNSNDFNKIQIIQNYHMIHKLSTSQKRRSKSSICGPQIAKNPQKVRHAFSKEEKRGWIGNLSFQTTVTDPVLNLNMPGVPQIVDFDDSHHCEKGLKGCLSLSSSLLNSE